MVSSLMVRLTTQAHHRPATLIKSHVGYTQESAKAFNSLLLEQGNGKCDDMMRQLFYMKLRQQDGMTGL